MIGHPVFPAGRRDFFIQSPGVVRVPDVIYWVLRPDLPMDMFDPSIQLLIWFLAALLIVVGFAGLILPAVPGIPLVFAGRVLLAWAENFVFVGWGALALLGVFVLDRLL